MDPKVKNEQELCVSCGFCCDNTLFHVASLDEDESIPVKLKKQELEGDYFFKLPCPYFDCKCTIYDQSKPKICSAFKCELIREMNKENVSLEEAKLIVENVKTERDQILKEYQKLTGESISFRDLHTKLNSDDAIDESSDKKLLKLRTTLLDIQIMKNFKTEKEFNKFFKMTD